MEWDKFYPQKVLQIGGVKLSTQISHVNFFYPEELSKIGFIQRLTWLILGFLKFNVFIGPFMFKLINIKD